MLHGRDTTPCASPVVPTTWTERSHSAHGLSQSLSLLMTFQHGSTLWPVAPGCARRALSTAPTPLKFRQGRKAQGTNSGSWRTTDASTQESSSDAASCTSWFRSATLSSLKPNGVPLAQWPDANWVSSQSSRPQWQGEEPRCIGTQRSSERNVALCPGRRQYFLKRSFSLDSTRGNSNNKIRVPRN